MITIDQNTCPGQCDVPTLTHDSWIFLTPPNNLTLTQQTPFSFQDLFEKSVLNRGFPVKQNVIRRQTLKANIQKRRKKRIPSSDDEGVHVRACVPACRDCLRDQFDVLTFLSSLADHSISSSPASSPEKSKRGREEEEVGEKSDEHSHKKSKPSERDLRSISRDSTSQANQIYRGTFQRFKLNVDVSNHAVLFEILSCS